MMRLFVLGPIWLLLVAPIGRAAGTPLSAQTQYHNLDGGRPVRVEGTEPTARFAVDVDVAPFQVERLAGGTMRYRAEPKITYGALPFTEVELRVPLVQVNPPSASGALSTSGVAGVSLGAMHAFNVETTRFPAVALDAEVSLPVGGLAGDKSSYIVKGLLTRTTSLGRVHLNAGVGTYAIRSARQSASGCDSTRPRVRAPGDTTCGGGVPVIIDVPCDLSPGANGRLSTMAASRCMATLPESSTTTAITAASSTRSSGRRWFGGAAFDHSLPLHSTLLVADVFAERFIGLFPRIDWTAEVGARHQVTPILVVDVGVGRRFAGTTQSVTFVVGATYQFATPPWPVR